MKSEAETTPRREISRFRPDLKILRSNKEVMVGGFVVAIYLLTALFVEIAKLLKIRVTPYNPLQQNVGPALAPPSLDHLFGTDLLGRDVFSRIIAATPNDVAIGLVVISTSITIGVIVGSISASRPGLLDELLMRCTDTFFALPALVIAMVIAVALGPGLVNMMMALAIIWWPQYARLARGEALKIFHQNYVESARTFGRSTWKIIVKHVVPNIFTTMLVYATLDIGTVIVAYSGLSYLGLSITPPYPDWGAMVSSFQDYILLAPWLPLSAGFAIALEVVGFSLLGDGLRDALESR
jgi:peptide/nickel transport system permease protein